MNTGLGTLHLLRHSPFTATPLQSCLGLLADSDGLLLSGDAVYALAGSPWRDRLMALPAGIGLYALEEDLVARAIATLPERLQVVDYPAFVALCERHARVNGWT